MSRRIPIGDFPHPVGSFVRSSINCRFEVQEREGSAYLERAPEGYPPGAYGQFPPPGSVFTTCE